MNFRNFQKQKSANQPAYNPASPRNPLNSHIFEKLAKLRSLAETRGSKNQVFCYGKILRSLSRYPLPILSMSQVIELEGVGDKTAHMIQKMLRKQYEGFREEGEQNEAENFCEDFDKNETGIDSAEEGNEPVGIHSGESGNFFEEFKMQKANKPTSLNKRPISEGHVLDKDLEALRKKPLLESAPKGKSIELMKKKSILESGSKGKSAYKCPDPETTTAAVLVSLLAFQSKESGKYASRKEIKKIAEGMSVKVAEIGNWSCLKTLLKHDIIYKFEFDGVEKYCLSQEGEKIAEKLLDYHLKIMERTKSHENSRNFEAIKEKPPSEVTKSNDPALKPIAERNSSEEKTGRKREEQKKEEKTQENIIEFPLERIESLNVVLVVDNREIKNQEDRTFIHKKLTENGLDCELGNLPLGDFLWIARIKEKIKEEIHLFTIDYIVERKKADDLASSILDGRYSSQRARLKKSQIPNIFWLIEGKPSQNSSLPLHVLETTAFHLQFTYGFKVQKTDSLSQTLKWLSQMTLAIQRKIKAKMRSRKPLRFQMTLEDFLLNNAKTSNTVGEIFKNMLTNIKDCGKKACESLYNVIKTPREMYEKLMGLDSFEERVEFLSLKARKMRKKIVDEGNAINLRVGLAKRLALLFCEEDYPEVIAESENEDADEA